jgi:hypothetical protein
VGLGVWVWWAGCSFNKLWHREGSVLARSLIDGAHAVCGCLPVAILDLLKYCNFEMWESWYGWKIQTIKEKSLNLKTELDVLVCLHDSFFFPF